MNGLELKTFGTQRLESLNQVANESMKLFTHIFPIK